MTSPTYTIGHRYDGVSHLDLYRFEQLTDADWGALEPYFEDAIVFVEWPERGGRPPAAAARERRARARGRRATARSALESGEPDLLAGLL